MLQWQSVRCLFWKVCVGIPSFAFTSMENVEFDMTELPDYFHHNVAPSLLRNLIQINRQRIKLVFIENFMIIIFYNW